MFVSQIQSESWFHRRGTWELKALPPSHTLGTTSNLRVKCSVRIIWYYEVFNTWWALINQDVRRRSINSVLDLAQSQRIEGNVGQKMISVSTLAASVEGLIVPLCCECPKTNQSRCCNKQEAFSLFCVYVTGKKRKEKKKHGVEISGPEASCHRRFRKY